MTKKDETQTVTAAVAPRQNGGALAIPTDGAAGLGGHFDQRDIAIPICSLVQPMSQDKGKEGTFWFPDGRSLDLMLVAVLDIVATRSMWAPVGDTVAGPLCRSNDRVYGYTQDPARVLEGDVTLLHEVEWQEGDPIPCERCPHYEDAFTFVAQEKGTLVCRYGYTLLLYDTEADAPFLYFVKGTAVKPVKQRIVSPALLRYKRTGHAEPWQTLYKFEPRLVTQPGRKFYVPDITPIQNHSDEERAFFAEKSQDFSGRAAEQTIEDEPAEPGQPAMALGTEEPA